MSDETACETLKRAVPRLSPGEMMPADFLGGITIYNAVVELIERVERLEEEAKA